MKTNHPVEDETNHDKKFHQAVPIYELPFTTQTSGGIAEVVPYLTCSCTRCRSR